MVYYPHYQPPLWVYCACVCVSVSSNIYTPVSPIFLSPLSWTLIMITALEPIRVGIWQRRSLS